MPFIEGAQYGIELFYPFDTELRVTKCQGQVVLDGDFGPDPMTGIQWPPFRSFGEEYYSYQLLLDLQVDDDVAVRTEPHPRYYTSPDDDVPLAVPALLRTSWWPMISFVIFKAPPEGRVHIFRPGEPFMQILFLPAEPHFELAPMTEEEAAERELRSRRIHASRDTLGKDSMWTSSVIGSSSNCGSAGTNRICINGSPGRKMWTRPSGGALKMTNEIIGHQLVRSNAGTANGTSSSGEV